MTYTLVSNSTTVIRDADGAHIPPDPTNSDRQDYQAWLDAGNAPNPVPPPSKAEEAADWLDGGLTVNFTSGAAPLSGRYGVVAPHSLNINSIATSMAYDGNALPMGGSSVMIQDLDGNAKQFDKNSFKLLMRATRDFIYQSNLYVMGQADALPPNVTSKSIEELPPEVEA